MTAKNFAFLIALAALLGACSSTPVAPVTAASPAVNAVRPAAAQAPATGTPNAPAQAGARSVTSPASGGNVLPAYLDPQNILSKNRSVFFDFDEFIVKGEYRELVERHGNFLASNPQVAIRIEGNTDERGGAEYNLALGQKRAEAVRQALKVFGARDAQMEAVSWGEEKPKASAHDEAAWAENRRADLQYPTK
jgi:peptidoglycan-associated lipoprotein